jgi:hypothetical protein
MTSENGQFCRGGLDAHLGPGSGLARELQAYAPLRRHRGLARRLLAVGCANAAGGGS